MEVKKPTFSVIICTALRHELLQCCIESLTIQTLSPKEIELIVINNVPGSGDEIQLIVNKIHTPIDICVALEEEEGLSPARNRGISMAKGEILAFIDDDAIAAPDWLEAILKIFQTYPDAAAVGGKISLFWETDPPKWLNPDLFGYLGEFDDGEKIISAQKNQRLRGSNFAIKRSCVNNWGGFSHKLGRNRNTLLSGEEVELLIRIQAHGEKCYYTPEAVVYHPAPLNRMNKNFFRNRAFWGERSSARIDMIHFSKQVFRNLLRQIARLPYHSLRSFWFLILNNPGQSFLSEIRFFSALGYIIEVLESAF
jgi:GT2 family glycosyltransferase